MGCLSEQRGINSGIPKDSGLVSSILYKLSSGSETGIFLAMIKSGNSQGMVHLPHQPSVLFGK